MSAQNRHVAHALTGGRPLLVWSIRHQHGIEHVLARSEACARRVFEADHGLAALSVVRAPRADEAPLTGYYGHESRAA